MQRVSAFLPSWDKRSSGSGANAGKAPVSGGGFFGWSNRASTGSSGASIPNGISKINVATANAARNRNSKAGTTVGGRVQREAFWPATLDLECEKSARIIKSFCADGFLAPLHDAPTTTPEEQEPQTPLKVPQKIPKRIIQNAAGIAVFTCMRSGLWMTGSGGSGILIARKSDGTWSPPSGIMLHTPTLSFIIGVDVYDCVMVINSLAALESITRPRVTLGEDVGMTSGPLVPLDPPGMETDINLRELGNTVLTYVKSRGQAQVVNLKGCILTERANENERFYESSVTQMDVLSGNVSRHVEETQPLAEVIKLAEGRTDFDSSVIRMVAAEPAPGDASIASPNSTPQSPRGAFGVPQADDPDPFGVLALEMAGMEIREAGSRLRPASSQMDFHVRPVSSALSKTYRQSGDTFMTRSNRESCTSTRTVKSQMTDAHTQTDTANTPETSPSPAHEENSQSRASLQSIKKIQEMDGAGPEEIDYTAVDLTPLKHLSQAPSEASRKADVDAAADRTDAGRPALLTADDDVDRRSKASSMYEDEQEESDAAAASNDEVDDESDEEEEPVILEVAAVQPARTQAVASRMIQAKGNMVTIPKRIPPPLPARNPARGSLASKSDISGDVSSLRSPLRYQFSDSELNGDMEHQQDDAAPPSVQDEPTEDMKSKSRPSSKHSEASAPETDKTDESDTHAAQVTVLPPSRTSIASDMSEPWTPQVLSRHQSTVTDSHDSTQSEPHSDEVEHHVRDNEEIEAGLKDAGRVELRVEDADGPAPTAEDGPRPGSEAEALEEDESNAQQVRETGHVGAVPAEDAEDSSESNRKGRLSVDTGATGTRSSLDNESSYTTPTSERRFSLDDDDVDETPKKANDDAGQSFAAEEKVEAEPEEEGLGNQNSNLIRA